MIIKGVTCDTVYIVLTTKLTNHLTDHLISNLVTPFDSCLPLVLYIKVIYHIQISSLI